MSCLHDSVDLMIQSLRVVRDVRRSNVGDDDYLLVPSDRGLFRVVIIYQRGRLLFCTVSFVVQATFLLFIRSWASKEVDLD